jgi:uncharacterized protein
MYKDLAFSVIREISDIRERLNDKNSFHIQMTGGEATLYPDVVTDISSFVRGNKIDATLGIHTNGTLLERSFVRMLKSNNFQVGVSLDGSFEMQEMLRGNAEETFRGMKLLSEEEVPFTVTSVISNKNINEISKLPFILSAFSSCIGIGFDLLVNKRKFTGNITSSSPSDLKQNLIKFLDILTFVNSKSIKIQFRELNKLKKQTGECFCHAANGTGIAVLPDGKVYPCSQTAGDDIFFLGYSEELANLSNSLKLKNKPNDSNSNCKNCLLNSNCPLECPSRLFYNQNDKDNLSCIMYQTINEYYNNQRKLKAI